MTVGELATLLKAITDFVWAAIAAGALIAFRREIRQLFGRLRKGKVGNIEIELDQLQKTTEEAAREIPIIVSDEAKALPLLANDALLPPKPVSRPEDVATSPKLAIVLLAATIEREVRAFIAATGHSQGRRLLPLHLELERLELPRHLVSAVRQFWNVRNRVVHGRDATEEEALRAMDSGLSILETLRSIPREINIVYYPGAQLYMDCKGQRPITDARGIILQTIAVDGHTKSLRIFPTTRRDYVKGKQVAWEWNPDRQWGETWYRDPESGEIKPAWNSSMEFIGRHLDEV